MTPVLKKIFPIGNTDYSISARSTIKIHQKIVFTRVVGDYTIYLEQNNVFTSLRGRRSKGKGKGILIRARDHARGRREERNARGGGNPHMKGVGMPVGNFELNP